MNGFSEKIKDGQIPLNPARRDWLRKNEGKWVRVELETKTRSSQQNRYLWAYYRIISQETGDTENDLHEYLKRKLLPPRIASVLGKEFQLPASTTALSKTEMGEYIERISALTHIPPPDPTQLDGYIQG